MKKHFSLIFLCFIFAAVILTSQPSIKVMNSIFWFEEEEEREPITIVIDPGHGGRDPGKVGVNHSLEKDINLSIAFLLKDLLEEDGNTVIMTREGDVGLYSESDSNKKRADLNKRVDIIHSSGADLAISIHQNSFTQDYVRGAQVFYYAKSEQGKRLAELIQEQIKVTLGDGNHRKAKANTNYYMLTKTECPLVIVECGYLSNPTEAALLMDEEYQEKLAIGIQSALYLFLDEGGLKELIK